jgi:signal transduction histidine kinase
MMNEPTELLLQNQQLKAEIERLRQENTFLKNEVESSTLDIAQLEGDLLDAQVKINKRSQTFKCIQLMYQEIASAKEVDHIYSITVKYLAEKVGFDQAIIFKKKEGVFLPVASCGYAASDLLNKSISHSLLSKIANEKKGVLVNSKTRSLYTALSKNKYLSQYFMAVPFSVQDKVSHILFVGNKTEDTLRRPRLTDSDVETLQTLSNQIAIVISKAELHTQTKEVAITAKAQAQKLKEALRKLQQTQAQLIQTEKMSGLGQLVAGVAHEINNPVTFISGNLLHASRYVEDLLGLLNLYQTHYPNPVEPIQEEAEEIDLAFLKEDLPKVLNSMGIGAERISQIVRSLRDFSRTEQAEMKPFNIHEGIDSTLLILQHRLKPQGSYSGIEIIRDYADLPLIECYASQLNQVFMNILSNGIDALEEQKENRVIKISTEVRESSELFRCNTSAPVLHGELEEPIKAPDIQLEIPPAQSVVIRIRDNGPGMTEAVRKHLFDPFFTTKPVGKGTGLGLSISYQIVVEKHGGILKCYSEPGMGAEFWIEIPLKLAESRYTDQSSQPRLLSSHYLVESVA